MLIRTICDVDYVVDSPSYYRALAWPGVCIYFGGMCWILTDGKVDEEYPSVDAAAQRFREAVDLALEPFREQS